MDTRPRHMVHAVAAIALAPIVVFATPRPGDAVAYLLPLSCLPIPMLAGARWSSPWSIATLGTFGVALGLTGVVLRRGGNPPWWQGELPLAGLSLAGSMLVVGSFALLGSGLIALIWSGIAAASWNLLLLLQARNTRPGLGQAALCLWLLAGLLFSLFGAVFGVMAGLCC